MTRPLASGIVKIKDRVKVNGQWEEKIHILRPEDGPKPKMKSVPVFKRDARGDFELDESGEKIPYIKNGKAIVELKQDGWIPAEGRDYHDEDYVLSIYGAILERC
jgi:hypothetical protein